MSRDLTAPQTDLPFPDANAGVSDTTSGKQAKIPAAAWISLRLKTANGAVNLSRYGFAVEDSHIAKLIAQKLDAMPTDEARAAWLAKCIMLQFSLVTEKKASTELSVADLLD